MPLPENNTLYQTNNKVESLGILTKADRRYLLALRSPNETSEELKLPKSQPTSVFRISQESNARKPYLVVATVDFENWEVMAASELVSPSTFPDIKKRELKALQEAHRDILTLFFFDRSQKNGNKPINLGLRPKVNFLADAQKEALSLFINNPDFEVVEGVEPAPKTPKRSGSGNPVPASRRRAPRKKTKNRPPRAHRDPIVKEVLSLPAYYLIGVPERDIKPRQICKEIQELRTQRHKEGEQVDVYKIATNEGKKAPHILVSTSDNINWKVWAVNAPQKLGEPEIESLSNAFISFVCVHSQHNDHKPIDVQMKSMPGWLTSAHKQALSLFKANPNVVVVEHSLKAEDGQKILRDVPSQQPKDEPAEPASNPSIEKTLEIVEQKKARAAAQGPAEDANKDVPDDEKPPEFIAAGALDVALEKWERKVLASQEEQDIDTSRSWSDILAVVDQKTARITRSQDYPAKSSGSKPQPQPDIEVKITPAIMRARRLLVAQCAVPSDVNWNNPDTHQQVLAEVERLEAAKAARSSGKLGAAKSTVAQPAPSTPQPDANTDEVEGL